MIELSENGTGGVAVLVAEEPDIEIRFCSGTSDIHEIGRRSGVRSCGKAEEREMGMILSKKVPLVMSEVSGQRKRF